MAAVAAAPAGQPVKDQPCCTGALAGLRRLLRRFLRLGDAEDAGSQAVVVLVGMRAAGKTVMGKVAATKLQKQFLDLDAVLQKQVFGCSINEFVDAHGWAKFREAEAQLLTDVLRHGRFIDDPSAGCIVATGGGVVETPSALAVLEAHSPVIWVDRHIDDIISCLEGVGSYRPGLGTPPREIYARRRPLYDRCSDFVFTMRRGDDHWLALERRFEHLAAWACSPTADVGLGMAANPVCVPIVASTLAEACSDMEEAAAEGAGLVELRVDKLRGGVEAVYDALPKLLGKSHSLGLPALVTFRPVWEDPNAGYSGEETPRLQTLQRAARLGAALVDVERPAVQRWAALGGMPPGSTTQLIVSSHDFNGLLELPALRELFAQMRGPDAAAAGAGPNCIVKVAQMARSSQDTARMLAVLAEQGGKPTLALAMAEVGVPSRVLSPYLGATLTFGCLEGRASAPGQPTVTQLLETYRLGAAASAASLRETKVFALLGDPVADSKLPAMLNAAFAADHFNAVLVPMLVRGCSLTDLLDSLPPGLLAGAALLPSQTAAAAEVTANGAAAAAAPEALLPGAGAGGWVRAAVPDRLAALQRQEATSGAASEALAFYELFRGSPATSAVRQAVNKL